MAQYSACESPTAWEWDGEDPGWNLCRPCLHALTVGSLSPEKVLRLRRTSLRGFYLLQSAFYDGDGGRTKTPMP